MDSNTQLAQSNASISKLWPAEAFESSIDIRKLPAAPIFPIPEEDSLYQVSVHARPDIGVTRHASRKCTTPILPMPEEDALYQMGVHVFKSIKKQMEVYSRR